MDLNSPTKETIELISSGRSIDFEELNILTPGISWSPDGKKLVVSAKSAGEDALYIVDVKTGDYQKLFGIRSLSSALWSPDGSSIAFVASVGEQPDLWLYDVKTGEIIRATDDIFTDMFLLGRQIVNHFILYQIGQTIPMVILKQLILLCGAIIQNKVIFTL